LYDATRFIAGESVDVKNILPFGTDPHSFELTPKIMVGIEKSSLVFYSGAGLEPWIDKIHFNTKTVDMSQYVQLRKISKLEASEHHHEHHSDHKGLDPHYWLDFGNMQKVAMKIAEELTILLPKNKEVYLLRRDKYIAMLQGLDEAYKKALSSCKVRNVILNHNALGYLANRYHFHSESLSGLSPEAVPSPSDIKRILLEIQKDNVDTIFYENFVNARVIDSIAKDANVTVGVIQVLGNITADQAAKNATYKQLMYENLKKLSKAMQCN
jgi:zinc transport system substrate-binding protein